MSAPRISSQQSTNYWYVCSKYQLTTARQLLVCLLQRSVHNSPPITGMSAPKISSQQSANYWYVCSKYQFTTVRQLLRCLLQISVHNSPQITGMSAQISVHNNPPITGMSAQISVHNSPPITGMSAPNISSQQPPNYWYVCSKDQFTTVRKLLVSLLQRSVHNSPPITGMSAPKISSQQSANYLALTSILEFSWPKECMLPRKIPHLFESKLRFILPQTPRPSSLTSHCLPSELCHHVNEITRQQTVTHYASREPTKPRRPSYEPHLLYSKCY